MNVAVGSLPVAAGYQWEKRSGDAIGLPADAGGRQIGLVVSQARRKVTGQTSEEDRTPNGEVSAIIGIVEKLKKNPGN